MASHVVKNVSLKVENILFNIVLFSSVHFSRSVVSNSLQPCEPQHTRPPCPSLTPGSTQTHVHCVGDAIQPSHPLSSPLLLPSIFPSIRVFSIESALPIRWPKYRSFSFNISPSNEHPGLISFRMDWLDLLAVQKPLKSLLQHHSSKHQFFSTQLFYSSTLISIHDYWENRCLAYTGHSLAKSYLCFLMHCVG